MMLMTFRKNYLQMLTLSVVGQSERSYANTTNSNSKQAFCSENLKFPHNSHTYSSSPQTTHGAIGSSLLRAQAGTFCTKPDLCRVDGKEALYLAAVLPKHFASQVPLCSDPHLCGRELWPASVPRLTITSVRLWLYKWSHKKV